MVASLTNREEKRTPGTEANNVVPTKTKEYYAKASRKARQRRKAEATYLTRRNSFMQKDRPVLEGRIQTLKMVVGLRIAQNKNGTFNKSRKIFIAENEALKEEVRCYRQMSGQLKSFLSTYQNLERMSVFSLALRNNVKYMIDRIMDYAFFSAQQPVESRFVNDITSRYNSLIRSAPYDPSYLSADLKNIKFELRSSNGLDNSRWQRVDVYDVPVPKSSFCRSLSLATPAWGNAVLNSNVTKHPGNLVFKNIQPVQNDVSIIGRNMGAFKTNVATVQTNSTSFTSLEATYHETLEPTYFTSDEHFSENCEILVNTLVPSTSSDLIEIEKNDTNFSRGFIVREGSTKNSSHVTMLFRFFNGQVDYQKLLDNPPPDISPEALTKAKLFSSLQDNDLVQTIMNQSDHEAFAKLMALLYFTACQYRQQGDVHRS